MTPCDRRLTYLGSDISLTAARRPQEYRRWKGEIYALPPPKDAEPPRVSGSLVAFARNGRPLGAAYRDLYAGEYLPAGSLFTDPDLQAEPAELKFNFGEGTQRRPPLLDCPQHPPPPPLSTPRPGKRGLCGGAGAGPGSDAPRPPLPAPAPPGPDFKHDRAAALPAGVEAAVSPVSELGSTPAAQEPGPSGQEKGQEGRAGGEPGERGGSEPLGTGEPPPEAVPAAGPGPGRAPAGGAGLERADTVPNAA